MSEAGTTSDFHDHHQLEKLSFSNPLDHIPLALEHMGLTEHGQYVFSANSLDSDCDVLVLIREPGGIALSLYCTPVDAVDSEGNRAKLVRNQTIVQDAEGCLMITSSIRRCQKDANHHLDVQYASTDEILELEGAEVFSALLSHLSTLVSAVRASDLIDEAEFQERVKDACPHGDECL